MSALRSSGAPVTTATWIVSLDDGRVGFWTSFSARFFNAVGHLGKGAHPYGDLGVVITLDA